MGTVLVNLGLTVGCAYLIHKYVQHDRKKADGWWTLFWALMLLDLLISQG